jgi:bifunctional non-homologous end joining protein LigD
MLSRPAPPSGFIEPCLPSPADRVPSGPNWVHEIKHDGFRMMVRRDAAGVRDGDGMPCFDRLRYRRQDGAVFLFAFDLLEVDGRDLRPEPIEVRKATLASVLRKAGPGVQLNEHLAHPGDVVFRHACKMGLEGIVSKRLGSRYVSGRTRDWLKMKNPAAPAVKREAEEDWGRHQ